MPAISVIMPVYNSEKYLRDAIESVLKQTFTDFELLLIDDKEGKLAGLRGLERAFNAEVLDGVARVADAGGVK